VIAPEISVVMSVFNDERNIESTIQSILSQSFSNFEFIIINDGSTDNTESAARSQQLSDNRITVYNQENQGLTSALILGCAKAKGKYIARQDCGDASFPERLQHQYECLTKNQNLAMVSCGVQFLAPEGEEIYTIIQSREQAANGPKQLNDKTIKGPPHHGCVMFRKDLYEVVGGYRKEFKVAQDLDLWTRLIEIGGHESLQKIFYQAVSSPNSISSLRRNQQLQTTKKIIECSIARLESGSDSHILKNIVQSELTHAKPSRISNSNFYYFIASNLTGINPRASRKYLYKALQSNPLNFKALIKLILQKL